jgi:hypothetical protein
MTLPARARALWVVWFAVLAGSLFAMVRLNTMASGSVATSNRFGFTLAESAKQLGVDFVHQGPTFDHKLDHIMPQVASVGAAVAVADFNRDGWPDFYVTNSADGSPTACTAIRAMGRSDVAGELGVADVNRAGTGVSMGAGRLRQRRPRVDLFSINTAGLSSFTTTPVKASRPSATERTRRGGNANTAVWFDYDRDGKLDLFLPGYRTKTSILTVPDDEIMPESFG